jgi:hypothetical protein
MRFWRRRYFEDLYMYDNKYTQCALLGPRLTLPNPDFSAQEQDRLQGLEPVLGRKVYGHGRRSAAANRNQGQPTKKITFLLRLYFSIHTIYNVFM